jgi:hypothetical protein
MRTTVTLDSDVERILREEIHRSRKSFNPDYAMEGGGRSWE